MILILIKSDFNENIKEKDFIMIKNLIEKKCMYNKNFLIRLISYGYGIFFLDVNEIMNY